MTMFEIYTAEQLSFICTIAERCFTHCDLMYHMDVNMNWANKKRAK